MIETLKQMVKALEANRPINYCENGKGERFPMFENNPFRQEANEQAIQAGKQAIAELESQEPVAWGVFEGNLHDMFFTQEEAQEMARLKGSHAEVKPLYTHPPQRTELEPFEYWNAVEGWVKIDEVREHFDSVGCGTIYKTAGEDRVPVYTTPTQRTWVGLTEDDAIELLPAGDWEIESTLEFAKAIEAKLKEKNT